MSNAWKQQSLAVRLGQLAILAYYAGVGIGIVFWVGHLIRVSVHLGDSMSASIGISIVAIPIFLTLLSVFLYMFYGIALTGDREEPGTPGGHAAPSDHTGG